MLKAVGPTTVVSVQRNVYVAGQAAYQLSLVPRSSKSLVGSVLIAIDASRHIPLRVEVYARASSALAYSVGFTALTFGPPAASNFGFTPPPGATVKHVTVPSSPQAAMKESGLGAGGLGGLGLGLGPLRAVLGAPVMSAGPASSSAPLVRVGRRSRSSQARFRHSEEGAGHYEGPVRQESPEGHERCAAGQGDQGVRSAGSMQRPCSAATAAAS